MTRWRQGVGEERLQSLLRESLTVKAGTRLYRAWHRLCVTEIPKTEQYGDGLKRWYRIGSGPCHQPASRQHHH